MQSYIHIVYNKPQINQNSPKSEIFILKTSPYEENKP